MNWRGSYGNYMYSNVNSNFGREPGLLPTNGAYLNNGTTDVLYTGFTNQRDTQLLSDYYVTDASFVRLDNISIGYTFNQKPKAPLVQLTAAAQNVLIITDYKGLDPEISNGIDNNIYPRPITFTLGLNVNF